MLARSQRLTKASEIAAVKQKGSSVQGQFLSVLILQKQRKGLRFAFVISSYVSKKAVARNKLKRIMSQYLQNNWAQMKEGADILVIVKKSAVGLSSEPISKDLRSTLKRGLII